MVVATRRLRLRSAVDSVGRRSRQVAAAAVVAAIGLVASPGVEAQTTVSVNGASGNNIDAVTRSTTGGLVINQIFGVDYLIVGAGGGGGAGYGNGAGGGAGGLLYKENHAVSAGTNYPLVVGFGGNVANGARGDNGQNSAGFGVTAVGGGGGGYRGAGFNGGSGGGANGNNNNPTNGGSGTQTSQGGATGYGNAGGSTVTQFAGGGGGGAGAAASGGNGGNGLQFSITGTATYYAGGGSAGNGAGIGGQGGGGTSILSGNAPGVNGQNNTGGGGSGGSNTNAKGGEGGSGIVVVRYAGSVLPGLSTSVTAGGSDAVIEQSSYTGNGTNGINGQLYQVYQFKTKTNRTGYGYNFSLTGVTQATLDSRLATSLTGVIDGSGDLTFNGPGRLTLDADNTYAGVTSVAGGTLALARQAAVGGSSGITIASGALLDVSGIGGGFTLLDKSLGGAGFIQGDFTFGSGSKLVFSQTDTLTMSSGTASFFAGTPGSRFGIDDLIGLDENTPEDTYTLISGSVNTSNLDNVGVNNARGIGGGKRAYFESGSLQVVVVPVPEPGLALAGVGIAAAAWAIRRRQVGRPRG